MWDKTGGYAPATKEWYENRREARNNEQEGEMQGMKSIVFQGLDFNCKDYYDLLDTLWPIAVRGGLNSKTVDITSVKA
jgi:hypothetical protein